MKERVIEGFIELGWIDLPRLEALNEWFHFADISQVDNYVKPISEETFVNRRERQEMPLEFQNILERLRLKDLIPAGSDEAVSQRQRAL